MVQTLTYFSSNKEILKAFVEQLATTGMFQTMLTFNIAHGDPELLFLFQVSALVPVGSASGVQLAAELAGVSASCTEILKLRW